MTSRRTVLSFALCAIALAVAPSAHAEPRAQTFVRTKQEALMKLVKAGSPDAAVDKVFDEVLSYGTLAEAALSQHWAELKPEQREEFTKVLAQLVRNSYRRNLKKTLGYAIEYTGTDSTSNGELVRTTAKNEQNAREEPLSIDYLVSAKAGAERIVDVVTEGSSMVSNYRQSFNKIIKKDGFDGLLKKMKKKAASGSSAAD